MAAKEELLLEFTRLRRGWGLEAENLPDRIGPRLAHLFDLAPGSDDRHIRDGALAVVERMAGGFPVEDRLALRFALGAGTGVQGPNLTGRIQRLADDHLQCSVRTARRRVNRAFKRLAEEAATLDGPPEVADDDPDKGWHMQRLESLLRLDTASPEVIETRMIRSERDGLKRISARLSLPRGAGVNPGGPDLWAEVQYGAAIHAREKQGESHFRFVLDLPRVLQRGQEHKYALIFRTPPDQPMRPHYAYVPLIACESFQLRIRFDPARPPQQVWRFQGLAPRSLDEMLPGERLRLDDAAEVVQEFSPLTQGFGYGIGWTPWAGAAGSGL